MSNRKAAVVGTFDGVHLGHRFLLESLRAQAAGRNLQPLALTFADHPLSLIAPERVPARLMSAERRRSLLEAEGVEVAMLDFNSQLRSLTGAQFLEMLNRRYGVELFLLGFNNRIGSDRLGAENLAGKTVGGVKVLAADEHPELCVSSSLIRAALSRGDVETAARMLGRPYSIEGKIVSGKQLGRTIGFPTANLEPDPDVMIPATGVYAGEMLGHPAVINIGHRPTVEGRADAPLSIEAHLLGFSGDLYGRTAELTFTHRLRGEQLFESLEALKAQINKDIDHARDILKS